MDAARASLREHGPEACSLREVARRAGVSHAAPYHHFASREALLGAVAAQAFEEMDGAMAEAQAAAPADAEAQLVAVGMGYLLYARRAPSEFRLMIRPEHLAPRREGSVGPPACEGPYGRLDRALERLLGRRPNEVELHLCWAAVHGLALLVLDGGLEVAPAALGAHTRAVIERLAVGLRRTAALR
jgi:AcrR family transcriptional regulator